MSRSPISLSTYAMIDGREVRCDLDGRLEGSRKRSDGPFKLRWREDVEEDGVRSRVQRAKSCSTLAALRALHSKTQQALEAGEVAPEAKARPIPTVAALDQIALGWLRFKAAKGRASGTIIVYKSCMARIFKTIRSVRGIADDVAVPASLLSVTLFSELQTSWRTEDAAALRTRKKVTSSKVRRKMAHGAQAHAASPWRIYDLSLILYKVWQWAASQPAEWPGVPAAPQDRDLVLPRVPPRPPAPDAPTWAEMDAVVRRAYAHSRDLGDILAGERCTGLRVDQVESIRRRAIDVKRATLIVEVGKSEAEKAEQREIPIPRGLLDLWKERITATKADDFLFPNPQRVEGYVVVDTRVEGELWTSAEQAGEVRPGILKPRTRRKGRPNHALRAGYMAGLEAVTADVKGQKVRLIDDKVIDRLVGHHPTSTRDKHYSPPTPDQLQAAVSFVPAIDLVGPVREDVDDNLVQLSA
jgi:integrase